MSLQKISKVLNLPKNLIEFDKILLTCFDEKNLTTDKFFGILSEALIYEKEKDFVFELFRYDTGNKDILFLSIHIKEYKIQEVNLDSLNIGIYLDKRRITYTFTSMDDKDSSLEYEYYLIDDEI